MYIYIYMYRYICIYIYIYIYVCIKSYDANALRNLFLHCYNRIASIFHPISSLLVLQIDPSGKKVVSVLVIAK